MSKTQWKSLLRQLTVDTSNGDLLPVEAGILDLYEHKSKLKLPRSYRTYCEVFGAGVLANCFWMAVPGFKRKSSPYSLSNLNKIARSGDYQHYSKDLEQHKRAIFFCRDIVGSLYFFDPNDITHKSKSEYAVYKLVDDATFDTSRVSENVWTFVNEFCLGDKRKEIIPRSRPVELVFLPMN